jgi:hypothetical protein
MRTRAGISTPHGVYQNGRGEARSLEIIARPMRPMSSLHLVGLNRHVAAIAPSTSTEAGPYLSRRDHREASGIEGVHESFWRRARASARHARRGAVASTTTMRPAAA